MRPGSGNAPMIAAIVLASLAVLLVVSCGGFVFLALITPDELAALSPFNW